MQPKTHNWYNCSSFSIFQKARCQLLLSFCRNIHLHCMNHTIFSREISSHFITGIPDCAHVKRSFYWYCIKDSFVLRLIEAILSVVVDPTMLSIDLSGPFSIPNSVYQNILYLLPTETLSILKNYVLCCFNLVCAQ